MRGIVVFVLAVAVAAVVLAEEPQIRTNRPRARTLPLPKAKGVYHFAILGDRTGGPREGLAVLRRAIGEVNLLDPDLVMTVGDLIQGYNQHDPWLAEMREYKEIMKGLAMPWYPVAGNHDVYWRGSKPPAGEHEANYEEHFGPLWYWFPHKTSAFLVLYTDEGDPATGRKGFGRPEFHKFSDAQLAWLKKALADTGSYVHVFVFLHHPRWIEKFYPGNNWNRVHELLKGAGNVTAVFAGHIHRQRYDGKRDGIEYFTLSTTGGSMPFDSPGSGYLNHFNVVTVRDEGISVTTLPVGAVLDPKTMTPEHLADIDRARQLPVEVTGGPLLVQADGAARGELVYSIRNPASRPLDIDVTGRAAGGVTLKLAREGDDFAGAFSLPEVAIAVEYLTEARRIDLGEQIHTVALRPATIPEAALTAKENRALVLDGKQACVTAPARSFSIPDGPFTVEAWVAPAADGTTGVIAGNFDFLLYVLGGRPYFGLDIGKTTAWAAGRESPIPGGEWHHLAGVFDGETVRVFVDGKQVATAEASGAQPRSGVDLHVGAQCDDAGRRSAYFRGGIDEVRISKVARYGEGGFVPLRRHEADADTVVLLHFDAAFGPFTPDHSGSVAHACRRGGVSYVPVAPAKTD
jgi:hypothetical protein